ncbi:SWIM-type domain-containing protein [Favolaschia claudopus]|uniref:SWIM-type domain-containing protein n=1 Tax=Favolaschia claudopus TaxID=2862362 RepID=A0AAW0ACD2_9AGAR
MTRYEYNCAQSASHQRKSIKVEDVSKQRDKGKMTVYPCEGWLTIWGSADTSECKQGSEYEVEPIPLPDGGNSAGFQAFAFALPFFLRKWAGKIREIGLDSTFNTTKAGYECFTILGEVFGSGVPLGFLFLKSHNPEEGEKENYLRSIVRHLVRIWGLEIMQCLSDKDITEINALIAELPADVKYQLCFWHAIRAGRLAIVGRQPAYYNPDEAFSEYDWIDRNFVPLKQMTAVQRESANLEVAQEAMPTIRVMFNKQPVASAPARPRIVINLNGRNVSDNSDSQAALEKFVDSLDDDEEEDSDPPVDEDLDLSDRLDAAPSWLEPGDETVFSVVPGYLFCPAPHRRQILRLFIRHFCEHPLLPDRRGTSRTPKQIRDDAVRDMYLFCFQRGLREVWGYMWTAWYCPAKWKLWARSTSEDFISRWRTTMTVENLWRNLKHRTLHEFVHPRLDQVFYLIVTDLIPTFSAKMQIFERDFRPGRSNPLTPWQKCFKANWKKLSLRPLGSQEYNIDLSSWTCTCGQQKYSAYLLCKHLVQSFQAPAPEFFQTVIRRRVPPFYSHPLLKPKDGSEIHALDLLDGTVSDGDNPLGSDTYNKPGQPVSGTPSSGTSGLSRGLKRKRSDVEDDDSRSIIEISSSSGASSPIRVDEESDEEVEASHVEYAQQLARDFRAAAAVLEEQARNPKKAKLWLRSVSDRKLGTDVSKMVGDVRRYMKTSRRRETTWARKGDKQSRRYTRNTMGLHKADENVPPE